MIAICAGLVIILSLVLPASFWWFVLAAALSWAAFRYLRLIPALAVLLFRLAGVKPEIIRSTMYYFAMPVASLTPTFLLRYDPEAAEARTVAGYIVVASTLFCVLTIPLWTIVLDKLFT